ncbi:MAG: hypothetical protein Q4B67_07730 [Eubacteriales bacterium]|nr:hypothetical protein [Eubacteriales bacterium]
MKKIQRIVAVLLAVFMVIALAVPAFAAPGTVDVTFSKPVITRFGSITYDIASVPNDGREYVPRNFSIEIQYMRDGQNWKTYGSIRKTQEKCYDVSFSTAAIYRVRVSVEFVGGQKSANWSEWSDECVVTSEDVSIGGGGSQGGGSYGPGSVIPGGQVGPGTPIGPGTQMNPSVGPGSVAAGKTGWIQNQTSKKWYYCYANGQYAMNCWDKIDGYWYYFNNDGTMYTGWLFKDNNWYFLEHNGRMLTNGPHNVSEKWYLFTDSGIMLTGVQTVGGYTYYLDNSGAMVRNSAAPDGHYYDDLGHQVR